jgi:hypothetical protein
MKKIILIIMLALTGTIVNSQNCFWAKGAGSDESDFGYGITSDINGNVYVTGGFQGDSITFGTTVLHNSNPGGNAFFIAKYSAGGTVLWTKGASTGACGYAITTDAAGNVYATGEFADTSITFGTQTAHGNAVSYADFFVVKYDTDGNAIWANGGGGNSYDYGMGITVDDAGSVFITGNFYSTSISFGGTSINNVGTDYTDYFTAKFNSDGNPVWIKGAGGTRYEYGNGITACNGTIYVTGCFQSDSASFGSYTLYNDEPGNQVLFLADYDTTGNVLWAKEIDGLWGDVIGYGITHDTNGNLLVAGDFHADYLVYGNDTLFNEESGSTDIMIIKYDPAGNVLWISAAGGTNYDHCTSVAADSSGNAFVTGYFNSSEMIFENDTLISSTSNSTPEIFIAKYNSAGNYIWAKKAGGLGMDIGEAIATGPDDDVYFTGVFNSPAIFGDITLTAVGYADMFVADIYNFTSGITSFSDATCNGTGNGTAFTFASEGNLPYSYLWNTAPPQTTANVTNLFAGTFTVTITESYGCAQTHSVTINEPPADTAAICMVTVDSLSQYNIIVWDKTPYTRVDTFMVCREISTDIYQPIARIPYNAPSQFIDTVRTLYFPNTGNPNEGTYRYKIMLHDTCGSYGEFSPYHNTIYFVNNAGTFYWAQPYSIENGANPVAYYILMRDDSSNGNWHDVTSIAGTQQVISDPLYAIYQDIASWRVKTQWSISCSPTFKDVASGYSSSLSNIFSNNTIGLYENSSNEQVNIYPNPADDRIEISFPENSQIEILNIEGQVLRKIYAEDNHLSIDISTFAKGIYFMKVKNDNGVTVKKFIKE